MKKQQHKPKPNKKSFSHEVQIYDNKGKLYTIEILNGKRVRKSL